MESRRCLIIFSMTATTSASASSFLSSTSRCLIAASNRRMAESRCGSLAFMAAFMSSLMLAFSDMRSSKVGIGKMKRRDERLCPLHRAGSVRRQCPPGSIELWRQRLVAQALVVPLDGGGQLSLAVGRGLEAAQCHFEGLVFLDPYCRHAGLIPRLCCSKGANSRRFLAKTPATRQACQSVPESATPVRRSPHAGPLP